MSDTLVVKRPWQTIVEVMTGVSMAAALIFSAGQMVQEMKDIRVTQTTIQLQVQSNTIALNRLNNEMGVVYNQMGIQQPVAQVPPIHSPAPKRDMTQIYEQPILLYRDDYFKLQQ